MIRFWNGFTGPDGGTTLTLVRQFNRDNPGIELRMQRIEWPVYYRKLYVAGLGGRAPEVFVLHTDSLRRFAEAGMVRPIDDLVGAAFPVADIDQNVWRAAQLGDKHYGLPIDVHPLCLYYNRRLLHEAGFEQPPTDLAEFLAVARRITRASRDPEAVRWGFSISNPSPTVYSVMRQFGGRPFTPDASRCTLSEPANVAALRLLADLIHKERVAAPFIDFDPWVGFRQGKVGMTWNGIFMLPDLRKQKDLDFAAAPVACLGKQPAVWGNTHNFCLRAGLAPREAEAAWRFVRFYSDHALDWAEAGQVPARRSLRASRRFRGMAVQSQCAAEVPYVAYMPQIPFLFEFQTEFDLAVERALRGTATAAEALAGAEANVNKIIARRTAEGAVGTHR
ncbi:MAG: extracellular solute-binding protein [Armatimonadetes bacterium]|nr:extracellular solute-binding protein [Armatimonadota bacterium]